MFCARVVWKVVPTTLSRTRTFSAPRVGLPRERLDRGAASSDLRTRQAKLFTCPFARLPRLDGHMRRVHQCFTSVEYQLLPQTYTPFPPPYHTPHRRASALLRRNPDRRGGGCSIASPYQLARAPRRGQRWYIFHYLMTHICARCGRIFAGV